MGLIVMKFGGTSVSSEQSRNAAIGKIIKGIENGNDVAVVVSAMGRKGAPYATDTLLSLINDDVSKRDKDLLMSCGELISAVVISNLLNSMGYKACAVTGYQAGIVTDDNHGSAKCIYVNPSYLKQLISEKTIPIITGFQGASKDFEITTLGRGGSDTSAIIIGAALKADLVEIYTDVNGIMTADPRIVERAKFIDIINTDELFQMAEQGAKVIHPRAVEIAKEHNIDMKIKNNFSDNEGTTIINKPLTHNPKDMKDVVSSVALLKNRSQIKIIRVGESEELNLLKLLAQNKISLDLINIFPDSFIFTIDSNDSKDCEKIIKEENLDYKIQKNLAKITAIGSKMHGVPGVMAKIVSALIENSCEILQSADSHMNISCLINEEDGEKAMCALHKEFID